MEEGDRVESLIDWTKYGSPTLGDEGDLAEERARLQAEIEQEMPDLSFTDDEAVDYLFSSSEDEGKSSRQCANKENVDPNISEKGDGSNKLSYISGKILHDSSGNNLSAGAESSSKTKTSVGLSIQHIQKSMDTRVEIERLKSSLMDLGRWIKSQEGNTTLHLGVVLRVIELLEQLYEENMSIKAKEEAADMQSIQEYKEEEREQLQVLYRKVEVLEKEFETATEMCGIAEAKYASLLEKNQHYKTKIKELVVQQEDEKRRYVSKLNSWKTESAQLYDQLTSLQEENQMLKEKVELIKMTEEVSEKSKQEEAKATPELLTAFESVCSEKRRLQVKLRVKEKQLSILKKRMQELEQRTAVTNIPASCQVEKDSTADKLKSMQDISDKFRKEVEAAWSKFEKKLSTPVNTSESAAVRKMQNEYKEMAKEFQVKFLSYCQSEMEKRFSEEMDKANTVYLQKCNEQLEQYCERLRKSTEKEFNEKLQMCVQNAIEEATRDSQKVIESLKKQLKQDKAERELLIEEQKATTKKLDSLKTEIFSRLNTCTEQFKILSGNSNDSSSAQEKKEERKCFE